MAATTGHNINTGPYGENTEIYSSLKLLHWLNLNCASVIGRSFTNVVFFMLIGIPRWLPLQDIVFTKDQLVLFITRWTIQALESLWLHKRHYCIWFLNWNKCNVVSTIFKLKSNVFAMLFQLIDFQLKQDNVVSSLNQRCLPAES